MLHIYASRGRETKVFISPCCCCYQPTNQPLLHMNWLFVLRRSYEFCYKLFRKEHYLCNGRNISEISRKWFLCSLHSLQREKERTVALIKGKGKWPSKEWKAQFSGDLLLKRRPPPWMPRRLFPAQKSTARTFNTASVGSKGVEKNSAKSLYDACFVM